jgi:hypothetical protein
MWNSGAYPKMGVFAEPHFSSSKFLANAFSGHRNFLLPVQADDLALSHRSIGFVVAIGG